MKTIVEQVREREKSRKKFLHYFPGGFTSPKYLDWERGYKWTAHLQWEKDLNLHSFEQLLKKKNYRGIAARAVRIESRTNLLFSFEKMALRDAVATSMGCRAFALGLYDYLHGEGTLENKFNRFIKVVESLPRKQTRVFTWPVVTVFGFIASPRKHIFLKPIVTKTAAVKYKFPFQYQSRPNWETYRSLLQFASQVKENLSSLKPRDMIDIQSFIWFLGSEEYP